MNIRKFFEISGSISKIALLFKSNQSMAQLRKVSSTLKKTQYKSIKDYYEDLVRISPSKENGFLTISSMHLPKMIESCQYEEDVDFLFQTYYNFLGHFTKFPNMVVDDLLKKALQFNKYGLIFEVLKNHNYLMYYPHPDTLKAITTNIRTNKQVKEGTTICDILYNQRFIKVNYEILENIVELLFESEQYELLLKKVPFLLERRNIKVSEQHLNKLLQSFGRIAEIKEEGYFSVLQYLDSLASSTDSRCLVGLAFIKLKNVDEAVRTYQKLSEYTKNTKDTGAQNLKNDFTSQLSQLVESSKMEKPYLESLEIKL